MIELPEHPDHQPSVHDDGIPVGTVRATGGLWTWSDSVYAMHGFEPGEIVPTAEVMLAHCHPADRARLASVLMADDLELSYAAEQYRLIDALGVEHWVALTVEWSPQDDLVDGALLDLTARHARASAEAVTSMLSEALQSRSVIDQAKGAIQLVYGTDESTAFELLKWYSQRAHVKLRAVAGNIVDSLGSAHALPPAMKRLLDEELLDLDGMSTHRRPRDVLTTSVGEEHRFELSLLIEPRTVRLVVSGDVDLATAPGFADALHLASQHASAERGVVVDLTDCPHVGPAGLRELAAARRRLARRSTSISVRLSDELLDPRAVADAVDTVVIAGGGVVDEPLADTPPARDAREAETGHD